MDIGIEQLKHTPLILCKRKPNMKLRWLVGKIKQESKHDWCGKKWKNEWELHTEKILQYSLDGKTWEDVECEYFEVPQEDVHKYKWQ